MSTGPVGPHAQPDWWALAQRHAHKLSLLAADEAEDEAGGNATSFQSPALEAAPLGEWSSPFVEGPKPPPAALRARRRGHRAQPLRRRRQLRCARPPCSSL